MVSEFQLESLVLAAMLDDGISPYFLHRRFLNPEGYLASAVSSLDGAPDLEQITKVLASLLERGLVTCRKITNENDEALFALPKAGLEPDVMAFELWFELTPVGQIEGLRVMQRLVPSE
jgi:hypothetical protein